MTLKAFVSVLAIGATTAGTAAMADGRWPDLPVGVKSGIAARVGDTAYVGLGSAGTDFFSLDLADPSEGWVRRAAFDGPATSGAAAAASGSRIYVFSGNGKPTPDAASPIIFDTVHVYDTEADTWSTVDTTTPAGLSGAKALALSDGRIAIIGGYNKAQFDTYLADVAATDKEKDPEGFKALVEAYMGREPEAYAWNDAVLAYDPAANSWSTLGENPYLPNCDPAVVGQGDDAFLVIGGEIKPGLRTPQVKTVAVEGEAATWQELAEMPAPEGEAVQEGLAGAYAAAADGAVLVAGGANFPGARANSEAGRWFAHDGLKKTWRSEVYALTDAGWQQAGAMPHGLGYGASFAVPEGLLVVGGEDSEGTPRAEVFALTWDGEAVTVVD